MKKFVLTGLLTAAFAPAISQAMCVQNNNVLNGLVGLDSPSGNVYATITSESNECGCTNVRFRESNTDTKMVLSVLLSAKMSDKEVRIDILDKEDCNTGVRVYIQS